ncbi:hypothetical protein CTAYLR_006957 [Chrysophaeum taylorii]|uniref:RBR-type E3 ubiquitin transferase n=1 Tax=Chrysophaeum taylorii TaxID=2483200 RepID=A0AAD7UDQ3_9STRA|nr:hypothetical protein CTAYLR_006957 [Chrysophaeum taylorii]
MITGTGGRRYYEAANESPLENPGPPQNNRARKLITKVKFWLPISCGEVEYDDAAPDEVVAEDEDAVCGVCLEATPARDMFVLGQCNHRVCLGCATGHVRAAMGSVGELFVPGGVRCPMVRSNGRRCACAIDYDRLRSLSEKSLASFGDVSSSYFSIRSFWIVAYFVPERESGDPLSTIELAKLQRFCVESAIPSDQRTNCPACQELVVIDGESGRVVCGYCGVDFCAGCRAHPWHRDQTCAEHEATNARLRESKSEAYVRATSKPCPNCTAPTSHFHGHGCHHISPGGGCPWCRAHWCYKCGATEAENVAKRGRRSACRCTPSSWTSFCEEGQIAAYLRYDDDLRGGGGGGGGGGLPYDVRCGCHICPFCRPGAQCDQCDGSCVVCRGLVPPPRPAVYNTRR